MDERYERMIMRVRCARAALSRRDLSIGLESMHVDDAMANPEKRKRHDACVGNCTKSRQKNR